MLRHLGLGAASLAARPLARLTAAAGAAEERSRGFLLPPLPYAYDALEPHLDARTMEIHHSKHHQAYVTNLNIALKNHRDLLAKPIEQLLRDLDTLPEALRTHVRNFGGGHHNHLLFWTCMKPNGGGEPTGALADAIAKKFGGFTGFKEQFTVSATKHFGSGWTWLVKDHAGNLSIITTANQDSPLSLGLTPLLALDLWEHAYYLKCQNRRAEFVLAWWNVINWNAVNLGWER